MFGRFAQGFHQQLLKAFFYKDFVCEMRNHNERCVIMESKLNEKEEVEDTEKEEKKVHMDRVLENGIPG